MFDTKFPFILAILYPIFDYKTSCTTADGIWESRGTSSVDMD